MFSVPPGPVWPLVAHYKPDLAALSPFPSLSVLCIFAFYFAMKMVVHIVFLVAVVVRVHSELVVPLGPVFPLDLGLDREKLHKVVDFDERELLAQLVSASEDAIILNGRCQDVFWWPGLLRLARWVVFFFLFSVFIIAFFTVLFLTVLAIAFFFIFVILFRFGHNAFCSQEGSHG